jgi:hypothetical protein
LPEIIEKSQTPEIIKIFKEYLLLTLIDYFKNDIILLNNLLEISKYIVLKEEDITKLISILVTDCDVSRIKIDTELPDQFKACGCCTKLPVYRKITSIIIDNKNSFKIKYELFYVQMQTKFKISLDYILI